MPRILLIEDSPEFRRLLAEVLRDGGHEVKAAADGREGIELFGKDPFDLVVTDVVMPTLGGPETIRALRRLRPGLKILATYGGGHVPGTMSPATAESLGADRLLMKPFSVFEFLAAVSEVLSDAPGGPARD